ncbi:concanavalin a-like lectin glucanase family protein [Cystoisospora suis]|uniref:Concanavalin a-like lectin glucanase family protein n=1 Tax=Cystoisospora suis TaxID=483139 RepID=A0A2C6LEL4_9APIC|nr:concanavalin a-like lectin glucanase family protein [Cystoisospora suis]
MLAVLSVAQVDVVSLPGELLDGVERAALKVKTALNFADKIYSECFDVPNALCLGGTSQVLTSDAVPDGLAAWFRFDELYPIDESGNGNHMHRAPRAGPPHNGRGASAAFLNGNEMRALCCQQENGLLPTACRSEFDNQVEQHLGVQLHRFLSECDIERVYKFVEYRLKKPDISNCFRTDASQTPTIFLYPNSRKLSIRVTTSDSTSEGMSSHGSLPLRRWTHVAGNSRRTGADTQCLTHFLQLRGVKDNEVVRVLEKRAALDVATACLFRDCAGLWSQILAISLWALQSSILGLRSVFTGDVLQTGYVDDLRFYNRAVAVSSGVNNARRSEKPRAQEEEVASLAPSGLTGIGDTEFVFRGLLAGVADVWHSDMTYSDITAGETRMGLCCRAPGAAPTEPVKAVA